METLEPDARESTLKPLPVLVAGVRHAVILASDGTARELLHGQALTALSHLPPPVVCHAPQTARRLSSGPMNVLDLLELFAFVRPAQFCLPTPNGVGAALGLAPAAELADEARLIRHSAGVLLDELADDGDRKTAAAVARTMGAAGWGWSPFVLAALGVASEAGRGTGLEAWRSLNSWAEQAPEPPSTSVPVAPGAALARLAELVGHAAETRQQQRDYAAEVTYAFAPRDAAGDPNVVLAEAGTGTGKTLGYVAPASVWAETNKAPVWISTYTRNLQRQVDAELDRLHPDPKVKARKVVVRKGRENYLCLLNFEEAVARIPTRAQDAVPLGLVSRWVRASRDGDMAGGDFPAWLLHLAGHRNTLALADRRGECIYSACDHYHKCFIEKTVRRARRADIVIANHALVMAQAALGGIDDNAVPTRLVFDEGHHVFDAADNAFSAHLTGQEAADLRRWLLGTEEGRRGRARGLRRRISDAAEVDETVAEHLDAIEEAAKALPGTGWQRRLSDGMSHGPGELFFARVRQQVYARTKSPNTPYDLETDTTPMIDGLAGEAVLLEEALARLANPLRALTERLAAYLDENASELDTAARNRLDSMARGLRRRADGQIEAWRSMLQALQEKTPGAFVDWFSVTRSDGRDVDVGLHRHWLDPTLPFAEMVLESAHGVVVTSATLRDGTGNDTHDWGVAEKRTGASHLGTGVRELSVASPFAYAENTRILVVRDVRKDDLGQVAAAYRELFLAAGGGALGLFTAISRLRAVHREIAPVLEDLGVRLLAQHVDNMDTGSLIDIFRAEEDACLLGTDAVRDGVDVPGRPLRLIVFDRVPWPRPSILHRARREAFGKGYDDMIVRLRLKQAFGRLVRRADDMGVFVVLDSMLPTRLTGAFPEGVEVQRVGLAEAVEITKQFLRPRAG